MRDHDDTDDELHDTDEEVLCGKGFGQEGGNDTDGDKDKNFPGQGDETCGQADDSEKKTKNFSRIDLLGRSLVELRKESTKLNVCQRNLSPFEDRAVSLSTSWLVP